MNEEKYDETIDDPTVGDLLGPLRSIEAPDELRRATRSAMNKAPREAEIFQAPPPLPWWQRRIAIPVPVLAVATIFMIVVSLHSLFGPPNNQSNQPPVSHSESPSTKQSSQPQNLQNDSLNGSESDLVYYENRFSVAGFGELEIETGKRFE